MKRTLIFVSMLAAGLWISGVALAGVYHQGSTLNCNECHTMHYSFAHTYGGTTPGPTLGGSGPYERLLQNDGANLCLSCHDQQSAIPDVSGTDVNSTGGGERAAGTLTTGTSPYQDWKGHTLTTSSVTPPGTSTSISQLVCASCHNPHGSSSYRNLVTSVSYTTATTAENTNAIRINLATVPAVGSRISGNFYSADYIYDNEPSGTDSQYGDFCASCHGNFHSTANTGSGPFTRHPTENVNFTSAILNQFTSNTNKVRVLTASNAGTPATTSTPSCQSCHKAHGNQNPFGLIYMTPTGTRTEQGTATGTPRDLCRQCHTQGG